jgi:IS5 family transposase
MSLQQAYQMTIIAGVFQAKLNPNHELLILAEKIDWERLRDELEVFYSTIGRAGKPIRLMVGAQILKHMHNLSDEEVVKRLCGDIYWMAFCGIDDPFTEPDWSPLDSSTMTNFRKRIGAEGVQKIETVIRDQLLEEKRISPKAQFVDTTAMEKNVAYPTDTNLLDQGRKRLIEGLKKLKGLGCNVEIGRTFVRKAKKELVQIVKLGKDRQERIKKGAEQLAKFAKKVLQKIPAAIKAANRKRKDERKQALIDKIVKELSKDAELLQRVIDQSKARYEGVHVKNKVYSFHESQVACISKGKRGKPNEYGSKVSISVDKNGFVVNHEEYDSNVGDNTTIEEAVLGWEEATGRLPEKLAADRSYHMPKYPGKVSEIEQIAIPRTGSIKHADSDKRYFKELQRKRASIEPVLSHLKQDHRMNRCRYKGFEGDQINVSMAVTSWNAKKWMRQLTDERCSCDRKKKVS